jgi:iron complex transport system ATP-binding protein
MLEARALFLKTGNTTLLRAVDLSVHPGEVTAVIGPNGAGKSSLLSVLSGLRRPDAGEVRIDGRDPATLSAQALARLRAVVEQHAGWQPGLTVAELVMMGGYHAPGPANWKTALRFAHCEALAGRRLETLSGGERQRTHLARALLQLLSSPEPRRYLLLDEPTAALDFGQADAMMTVVRELARQEGFGVVAVIHDINLAMRHADRALLMENGNGAAFGPIAEVMEKTRLEAIYGVRLAELISPEDRLRAFVPLSHPATRD